MTRESAKEGPAEVTFTQFLNYSLMKDGPGQLTAARAIKRQEDDYDIRTDFYRQFRDGLIRHFKTGRNASDLSELAAAADPKKKANFLELAVGAKRFFGTAKVAWRTPPVGNWTSAGVSIAVRPELRLQIERRNARDDLIIKLHFKEPDENSGLNKRRAAVMLALMDAALVVPDGVRCAVLDVRKGKLFKSETENPEDMLLLESQAASLAVLLRKL